jgi:hypothetical protein
MTIAPPVPFFEAMSTDARTYVNTCHLTVSHSIECTGHKRKRCRSVVGSVTREAHATVNKFVRGLLLVLRAGTPWGGGAGGGHSRQAVAPDDSGVGGARQLKELMVCKSVDESVGHLSVPHAGGEGGVQEEKKKGPAPVSNVTVVVLAWWAPHPAHTRKPCLLHRGPSTAGCFSLTISELQRGTGSGEFERSSLLHFCQSSSSLASALA